MPLSCNHSYKYSYNHSYKPFYKYKENNLFRNPEHLYDTYMIHI